MKTIIITCFALFSLSFSFAQQTTETINIDGVTRQYIQYLPANFNASTESLPSVIILHGLGGTNTQMATAGFNLIADTARCIVYYPQGLPNLFGQNAWNNGTAASSTANDIDFMNFLMDKSLSDFNADITRQYVTGFSMGSIMSYHLACNLNNRVAAIGAMAGPMSTSDLNACNPSYSTPIIHLHGTNDATVPYNSNALPSLSLVTETLDFWKNQKNCGTTQDSTRITDSANDGLTTDRFVYNDCNADGSLEHWRINGGGHDYYVEPLNDFSHAIEVWLFLRKWSHPNPLSPSVNVINENLDLTIFPNPATDYIEIELTNQQLLGVQLISQEGKQIMIGVENPFPIAQLENGIYYLKVKTDKSALTKRIVVQH